MSTHASGRQSLKRELYLCQNGLLVLLPHRLRNGGVFREDGAELCAIDGLLLLQELHDLVNRLPIFPAQSPTRVRTVKSAHSRYQHRSDCWNHHVQSSILNTARSCTSEACWQQRQRSQPCQSASQPHCATDQRRQHCAGLWDHCLPDVLERKRVGLVSNLLDSLVDLAL